VYHINLVDEVTQYEFGGTTQRTAEHYLLPVLESPLEAFPYRIRGLHSDNGSEYISHRVARLLKEMWVVEFTKSRPRGSNDNALVESKNGTVVRKHLGYGHIPGRHAQWLERFNREVLSQYLNYHHLCYFPSEQVDAKGQLRKSYRRQDLMTPCEKLRSLPDPASCLKPGIDLAQLDAQALAMSDNQAARRAERGPRRAVRSGLQRAGECGLKAGLLGLILRWKQQQDGNSARPETSWGLPTQRSPPPAADPLALARREGSPKPAILAFFPPPRALLASGSSVDWNGLGARRSSRHGSHHPCLVVFALIPKFTELPDPWPNGDQCRSGPPSSMILFTIATYR